MQTGVSSVLSRNAEKVQVFNITACLRAVVGSFICCVSLYVHTYMCAACAYVSVFVCRVSVCVCMLMSIHFNVAECHFWLQTEKSTTF